MTISTWKYSVACSVASIFVACSGEDVSLGTGKQGLDRDRPKTEEEVPNPTDDANLECTPAANQAFACVTPATAFNVRCVPDPNAGSGSASADACVCTGQCAVFDPACDPHACDGQAVACASPSTLVSSRCEPDPNAGTGSAAGRCILVAECAP